MNTLEEIAKLLKKIKSAVIFTHMRPDGDTLGSAMALSRALTMLGVKNEVVNEGEIPEKFFFLEGMQDIKRAPTFDAEAFIAVDVSAEHRLGELQSVFFRGAGRKITVNIDHHISNTRFCKYNYAQECSSNCENIAILIRLLGVKQDKLISEYLLMGLITDSGAFSHGDVTGDTFRTAAACLDAGADVSKVSYEAYRKQSRGRAQLYASVISHLRFLLENKLVIAVVTKKQLEHYGLKQDATEGIVDFGLSIDEVEVSVCLMETNRGQYKASFRSKTANVNEMARVYGGGGHILASGCMFFGDIEEIIDKLRYTVQQHLDL